MNASKLRKIAYGGLLVIFVYGGYLAYSKVNDKLCNVLRQNEQLIEENARLKVAMKFDNLFMLVADPQQVMDFSALESILQNRRNFYKTREKK